jgi:hypothetical protein
LIFTTWLFKNQVQINRGNEWVISYSITKFFCRRVCFQSCLNWFLASNVIIRTQKEMCFLIFLPCHIFNLLINNWPELICIIYGSSKNTAVPVSTKRSSNIIHALNIEYRKKWACQNVYFDHRSQNIAYIVDSMYNVNANTVCSRANLLMKFHSNFFNMSKTIKKVSQYSQKLQSTK